MYLQKCKLLFSLTSTSIHGQRLHAPPLGNDRYDSTLRGDCASGLMSRRETPPLHSFYGQSATHISGLLLESRCQIKLPFVSLSAEWVVFGNFTQMSGIISRNSKKPWSCWEYHTLWRKLLIMLLQINCLFHCILNRYHCNFFNLCILITNYFPILQWVLPYIDMNQPWVYKGVHSKSPSHLPPHPIVNCSLWLAGKEFSVALELHFLENSLVTQ